MQKYSAEETQQKTVSHQEHLHLQQMITNCTKSIDTFKYNMDLIQSNIIECFLGGESPQWSLSLSLLTLNYIIPIDQEFL